jgi:hypothetical protein
VLDGQPEPKKKRFVYFDQLQFLLPLICDGKESDDEFGNKSFLLSFLPLMDGVPTELAIEARYTITEMFRNISAARQASLSAIFTLRPISQHYQLPFSYQCLFS